MSSIFKWITFFAETSMQKFLLRNLFCLSTVCEKVKKNNQETLTFYCAFKISSITWGTWHTLQLKLCHCNATCGIRAAPALGQTQRAAPPRGGRLCVGEARRRAGRGCGAAPRALWDLPQLMGQRGLAVRNGAWRPSRFHLWQFTFKEERTTKVGLQNRSAERQLLPQGGVLQEEITENFWETVQRRI